MNPWLAQMFGGQQMAGGPGGFGTMANNPELGGQAMGAQRIDGMETGGWGGMGSPLSMGLLGAGLGINGFAAFAGGVLASYLTFGIVWPGLYLVVFKPLWNFGDWLFNKTRTLVKDVIAPLFNGAADVASKLPLAGHLWQVVRGEGENKKQWGLGVFQVIVGIASVAVSAWAGYNTSNDRPVIYSRTGRSFVNITSFDIGDLFDTQRRRENKLLEARSTSAMP